MNGTKKSISIISIIAILLGGYLLIFHWSQVKTVLVNWKNAIVNGSNNANKDNTNDSDSDEPSSTKVVLSLSDVSQDCPSYFVDFQKCSLEQYEEKKYFASNYFGQSYLSSDVTKCLVYWVVPKFDLPYNSTLSVTIDNNSYAFTFNDTYRFVNDSFDFSFEIQEMSFMSTSINTLVFEVVAGTFSTISIDQLTLSDGMILYENV